MQSSIKKKQYQQLQYQNYSGYSITTQLGQIFQLNLHELMSTSIIKPLIQIQVPFQAQQTTQILLVCYLCIWDVFCPQKVDLRCERDPIFLSTQQNYMHLQLAALLEKQNYQTLEEQEIGKAVDILRTVNYFKGLANAYGNSYLVLLLSNLNSLILRESFVLLDSNERYVLMQGDMRAQQAKLQYSRLVNKGQMIDMSTHKETRFVAISDCFIVQIKKRATGTLIQRKILEQQRIANRMSKQYIEKLQKKDRNVEELLKSLHFFECLGNYDFLQIAAKATIQVYNKNERTHLATSFAQKIGCIASGTVKINFGNHDGRSNRGMKMFLRQNDWIGLDSHLCGQSLQHSGEVDSMAAIIVWISVQVFSQTFSLKNNYSALNKLIAVVQTKKALFQRSLSTRRQKQQEILQANRKKNFSLQLQQKIKGLQQIDHKSLRMTFRSSRAMPPLNVPILHTFKHGKSQQKFPIIQDTGVLFPEDYRKAPVNGNFRKQMKRLQKNMSEKKDYEGMGGKDILMKTLCDKVKLGAIRKKVAKETISEDVVKQKPHFNQSIYNNFKIGQRQARLPKNIHLQQLNRTEFVFDFPENPKSL